MAAMATCLSSPHTFYSQVTQSVVPPSPARFPTQSDQDLDARLSHLRSQLEQVPLIVELTLSVLFDLFCVSCTQQSNVQTNAEAAQLRRDVSRLDREIQEHGARGTG